MCAIHVVQCRRPPSLVRGGRVCFARSLDVSAVKSKIKRYITFIVLAQTANVVRYFDRYFKLCRYFNLNSRQVWSWFFRTDRSSQPPLFTTSISFGMMFPKLSEFDLKLKIQLTGFWTRDHLGLMIAIFLISAPDVLKFSCKKAHRLYFLGVGWGK